MLRSSLFAAAGVAALASGAFAQGTLQPQAVTASVKDGGTLDWATGTWKHTGNQIQNANAVGAVTLYNNSCNWTGGAFFAGGVGTCFEWYDEGRIPSLDPADPQSGLAGVANAYTVCGWTFGYCTGETVQQQFVQQFWSGVLTQGVGGICAGPYGPADNLTAFNNGAAFLITGLPRSTTFDSQSCWLITLDLTNTANGGFLFTGNDDIAYQGTGATDNFGWSWRLGLASTAPNNTTGWFIQGEPSVGTSAGTFNVPPASDPLTGGSCGSGLGTTDNFWINTDFGSTCGGPASGCYFFGGYPGNPYGSFYLTLQGVGEALGGPTVYCTAKASFAGCTASVTTSNASADPVSGANDYSAVLAAAQTLRPGIFFTSNTGAAALPFSGGILCFFPPLRRSATLFTGGAAQFQCTGGYQLLINDGTIIPAGFDGGPGGTTFIQAWYRSPQLADGFGTALSNAMSLNWL